MFKVNNKNIGTTPGAVLMSLLLTLNMYMPTGISPSPVFLSNGIKPHARNTSKDDGRFSQGTSFFNYLSKSVA